MDVRESMDETLIIENSCYEHADLLVIIYTDVNGSQLNAFHRFSKEEVTVNCVKSITGNIGYCIQMIYILHKKMY